MSNCAREYKFVDKSVKVVESQAKLKFDLRQTGEKIEKNEVVSEKVHIPEIDAYWTVQLCSISDISDKFCRPVKSFSWELFINNAEIIKTRMYEARFEVLSSIEETIASRKRTDSKWHEASRVQPIYRACIVGPLNQRFSEGCNYEFNLRVTIIFRGPLSHCKLKATLSIPTTVEPCWLGEMKSLLDSTDLTDFTYLVDGKEFKVHKLILSLASPVFRSTFTCGLDETKENTAQVNNCEPEMFEHLLKFIYKGLLPQNLHEIAFDFYKLAHVYQIKALVDICAAIIMKTELTEENVINLYESAILYDIDKLKSDCWTFIRVKMLKILTPLEQYPIEKIRAFLEAESKVAEEIAASKNAKIEELRKAFAQNQL